MRDSYGGDERLPLVDKIVALVVGIAALAAMLVWGVPGLSPAVWDELSVVAGIRHPQTLFPGFWRIIVHYLFRWFGPEFALSSLRYIGALVGSGCVMLSCLIIRQIMALLMRTSRTYAVWGRRLAPFFAGLAALLFGLSDPLWNICRVFSPALIRFSMFVFILHLSLRWFVVGGNWRLFLAMSAMGVMAAETPFAFLLPAIFIFAYILVWGAIIDGDIAKPENLPDFAEIAKWRMFFIFLGSLAVAIWANTYAFTSLGGLEANNWSANDIYFRYIGGYWHVLADAASPLGWILGLSFCIVPMVVAFRIFPRVMRDDAPMEFNSGVILFAIGVLSIMQCGAFPAARFWTFAKEGSLVSSGFLLSVLVFSAMASLALSAAAFAFECQRKYLAPGQEQPKAWLRYLVQVLVLGVVALALVRVPRPIVCEVQSIVDDAIDEIVEECGDAKWLFTDGRLDSAIELAANRKGKTIRTLNMMSGASDWEINLRTRGFEKDSDDYINASTGVPVLLRVWAGEKTNGLEQAALQLGFEYWKREKKPLPKMSGMVARETGLSDEAAKAGIERTQAIAKRILAISKQAELIDLEPTLERAFSAVNWRIARFAHYREDHDMGNDLDLSNSALRKMLSAIEYERLHTFLQLTPHEGLSIALRRADFTEARRYASAVLRYDEENPEANFAVGMSALMRDNMKEAEEYLRKVLIKRPNEPAALNNLSIICRKQRRFKEAEELARKALEILPTSPEVKQTLNDALKRAP